MKSSFTIPIAIILGGIVVAGAVFLTLRDPSQTLKTVDSALVRPVSSSDHILGNPTAPVVVVVYSDFDCDFCKGFDETMRQIIASEGADGKVAWVFRQFPLTEIHPNAFSHARAAECVAQVAGNDAFWRFTGVLFANQPVNPANYGNLASSVGISGDAFATCYANASTTLDARINADRQNAIDIGAEGTPYSLILVKGKSPIVMNGAYSYDSAKQLINQALESVSVR